MSRYMQRAREEAGFTLIELMIVIVILAILAGIVLFAVGGVTDRGTVAACKTDLSTVSTAVEAYYAKHGTYPPDLDPTLTDPAGGDQFLRPQPSLTGDTQTGTGYVITYDPSTGDVTSNLASC